MKRHFRLALVVTFTVVVSVFALQPSTDPPKPFTGKVVGISDGDTITVLLDKQQHKIRLEGIDAPESGQAFGTKAKQVLSDKIFGKEVKVVWSSRDKYKRILGHVYLDDKWINKELVEEGFAWHYVKYSNDKDLAKAEKDAKEGKKGLWADPSPIPPWDFRKGKADLPDDLDTVYITASGKKYHRASCKYVAKSKMPISLKEAQAKYEPCSVCKPK
ncbi:MAG: nuclease [Planctomycetes bacterium]|nr:nuclease [Planctomycetota bacterium]